MKKNLLSLMLALLLTLAVSLLYLLITLSVHYLGPTITGIGGLVIGLTFFIRITFFDEDDE